MNDCEECFYPRGGHSWHCSKARDYPPAKVAAVMLELQRRESRLHALAAELDAMDEPHAALYARRAARKQRSDFWHWAEMLGVGVGTTRADIRVMIQQLREAERAAS